MGADTRVAQDRCLLHVLVQRHVIGASAQGKFRKQQGVEAVGGNCSLRQFRRLGRHRFHRRRRHGLLRLASAGGQESRDKEHERETKHLAGYILGRIWAYDDTSRAGNPHDCQFVSNLLKCKTILLKCAMVRGPLGGAGFPGFQRFQAAINCEE